MHCKFSLLNEKSFPRLLAVGSQLLLCCKPYSPPSHKRIHNCRQHRGCAVSVQATYHLQINDWGCRCQAGGMGSGVVSTVVSTLSLLVFGAISFSMERDIYGSKLPFGRMGMRPQILILFFFFCI